MEIRTADTTTVWSGTIPRRDARMAVTIGDVYGPYTVEAATEDPSRYLCRCRCGRSKNVLVAGLVRIKYDECTCRRRSRKFVLESETGLVDRRYFERLKSGAKRRGIPFSVTVEELDDLWEEQGGRCWYSGLNLIARGKPCEITASLDRSESDLPYAVGNVRWTHKTINQMKQGYSPDLFVWMCRRVAEHRCGE